MGVPSCGLKNFTPSSVTVANFNKLTIWNLATPSALLLTQSSRKTPNQPTTVSQEIVLPSLQLVCSPDLVQHLLSGLQAEMVRVVEVEAAAGVFELGWEQAFEGGLRGDGHEHGEMDGAMGKGEGCGAGFGGLDIV
jgi:hypothetical protein